jgi:hypothetical protein
VGREAARRFAGEREAQQGEAYRLSGRPSGRCGQTCQGPRNAVVRDTPTIGATSTPGARGGWLRIPTRRKQRPSGAMPRTAISDWLLTRRGGSRIRNCGGRFGANHRRSGGGKRLKRSGPTSGRRGLAPWARARHNERSYKDPQYRARRCLAASLRSALKSQGVKKEYSVAKLIGCSLAVFRAHIETQFEPGMTWTNIHLDHIRPCASFPCADSLPAREGGCSCRRSTPSAARGPSSLAKSAPRRNRTYNLVIKRLLPGGRAAQAM